LLVTWPTPFTASRAAPALPAPFAPLPLRDLAALLGLRAFELDFDFELFDDLEPEDLDRFDLVLVCAIVLS
jgi:hypothetical protein